MTWKYEMFLLSVCALGEPSKLEQWNIDEALLSPLLLEEPGLEIMRPRDCSLAEKYIGTSAGEVPSTSLN
jgi:hypothetical protein